MPLKKSFLCILISCISLISGYSQTDIDGIKPKHNAIVLSVSGDGMLGSITYERRFFNYNFFFLTARTGFGMNADPGFCFPPPCPDYKKPLFALPLRSTINLGWKQIFLEGGVSHTIFGGRGVGFDMTFLVAGIRYYPAWFTRIAIGAEMNWVLRQSEPNLRMLYFPYGASLLLRF
jgi:hypothetical protein